MEFLSELWMPIVVSAVFVFIASFLIHVVLPIHKGEWVKVAERRERVRRSPRRSARSVHDSVRHDVRI